MTILYLLVHMERKHVKRGPTVFTTWLTRPVSSECLGQDDSFWGAVGDLIGQWSQGRENCPQCDRSTKFLCGRCSRCDKCCWHLATHFVSRKEQAHDVLGYTVAGT